MQIFSISSGPSSTIFLAEEDGKYVPLPDNFWKSRIPNFRYLTETGREKRQRKILKTLDVTTLKPPDTDLPPSWVKVRDGKRRHRPTEDDCRCAVQALLSLSDLFPDPTAGTMLLATVLMGLRAADLTRCEPSLRPCVAFRGPPQLEQAMKRLFKAILPRKRWEGKRFTVKRKRIADLSNGELQLVDVSRFRVQADGFRSIWLPLPPENTILLVLHGRDSTWGRLSDDLSRTGVVFLNCSLSANGWGASSVPTYTVSAWDDKLFENVITQAPQAAWLLGAWWGTSSCDWARDIIRRAHDQLGRPDGRFRTFAYDPKALCRAVAYQVLLDFLSLVSDRQWLSPEEAEACRQRLEGIFIPTPPPPPAAPRRAEDPGVYLEKLRAFAREQPELIAPVDQPYVRPKRGKIAAAWRCISGEKYLVVEEDVWAAWYAKAIKAERTIDASFLQRPNWPTELQKVLGQAGTLKVPSAGYRYRYDLLGNGTRDKTFVVATPASLLAEAGQGAGQNAQPPASGVAGELAGDATQNDNIQGAKGRKNE